MQHNHSPINQAKNTYVLKDCMKFILTSDRFSLKFAKLLEDSVLLVYMKVTPQYVGKEHVFDRIDALSIYANNALCGHEINEICIMKCKMEGICYDNIGIVIIA